MAKNQHKKALEFLVPFIKDTGLLPYSYKMFYLRNLATCYMDVSNTSKGIEINNILLKIAKERKDNYEVWWAKEQLSYNYYLQGNIKRAVDTSLIVRNYLKSNPNIEAALNNSYHLGLYYRDLGDLKKAIFYTEESIAGEFENNESFVNKDLSIKYNVLASIYLKKRDYKKVDYYYKKVKEVRDSIRSREKLLFSTFIITNENLFEETQKNQEIVYNNTILEEKNTKQWLFIVILVIALVAFLLIIFTVYLLNKNKKGAIKVKKLRASEKKLLEEQIQLKNNELEATASLLSKRVAILNQLKKQLKATKFSAEEKVVNTLKIITQLINNASDMNALTNKISSRYASLTILLKEQHPDLSPRDIDYCLLTKLDLSIKETATILNVSPGTVKVARSRLKTRMNIPPEVSFKEYLNSIIE